MIELNDLVFVSGETIFGIYNNKSAFWEVIVFKELLENSIVTVVGSIEWPFLDGFADYSVFENPVILKLKCSLINWRQWSVFIQFLSGKI